MQWGGVINKTEKCNAFNKEKEEEKKKKYSHSRPESILSIHSLRMIGNVTNQEYLY